MKKVRSLIIAAALFAAANVHALVQQEKFTTDPLSRDWQIYGDTNLFQWNTNNLNMDVTWDSSQTNSYFYRPLPATYTKADSFCVVFDLTINDVDAIGYFQMAVGLCKFSDATSTNFSRSTGYSPNLFEFDYYPDGPFAYGPSIDGTLVDANDSFYFAFDDTQTMPTNVTYHIVLLHPAGSSSISGTVFVNNQVFTTFPKIDPYGADDFQVDTIAIFNYTTLDDPYGDSLLAHGTVDNLTFASPIPIDTIRQLGTAKVQFNATTNWIYTYQRTSDFQHWTNIMSITNCTAASLMMQDTNTPGTNAFYRVTTDLP